MKAHELYKQLDPAVVTEMFTTFREEEREVYKSAVASLAQARKLRPVYVQKKPVPEQIAWMHKTLALRGSDMIGEHLLQVWFMKFHQPMLVAFCDGMGIQHNGEGSVEGALPEDLDAEALRATCDELFANFNPKIVSLYLHVFNLQTPDGWDSLATLLANDGRIRLNDSAAAPAETPATEAEAEPSSAPAPDEQGADDARDENTGAEEAGEASPEIEASAEEPAEADESPEEKE